jgi:hypothetical protein
MTRIRSRHPFADILEREMAPTVKTTVVSPAEYALIADELERRRRRAPLLDLPHPSENRQQRRAGVATFTPHADLPEGPGLRRRLVKQRQRAGILDPELRRLQKAKLRAKGIR